MELFDKTFKEIFSSQIVSMIGGLIAGSIIAIYTNEILMIPGMLILLPGILEMRNSIDGSFASRLSAGLFLGFVKPTLKKTHLIKGNIFAISGLTILISLILGLIAFLFNYLVMGVVSVKIIFIALIAGILANAIEIPLTLIFTFYFFRRGHDPNNIMGPFITSTGDIISIVSLLLVLVIL